MEFDLISLLWGLPAAFALGWLASRFDSVSYTHLTLPTN